MPVDAFVALTEEGQIVLRTPRDSSVPITEVHKDEREIQAVGLARSLWKA
ncbi:hypothetical protein [Rhizobium sp. A37_96]